MADKELLQELTALLIRMDQDNPGLIERIDSFWQMKEAGYDSTELDAIWMRYIKHAGPAILITVYDLYMKSIQKGFSDRAAKAAIRLGLATEFGEQEYFTPEDAAECVGGNCPGVGDLIDTLLCPGTPSGLSGNESRRTLDYPSRWTKVLDGRQSKRKGSLCLHRPKRCTKSLKYPRGTGT